MFLLHFFWMKRPDFSKAHPSDLFHSWGPKKSTRGSTTAAWILGLTPFKTVTQDLRFFNCLNFWNDQNDQKEGQAKDCYQMNFHCTTCAKMPRIAATNPGAFPAKWKPSVQWLREAWLECVFCSCCCWWFRKLAFTSWGKGSSSHYLQGFSTIQTVLVCDFFHQEYFGMFLWQCWCCYHR